MPCAATKVIRFPIERVGCHRCYTKAAPLPYGEPSSCPHAAKAMEATDGRRDPRPRSSRGRGPGRPEEPRPRTMWSTTPTSIGTSRLGEGDGELGGKRLREVGGMPCVCRSAGLLAETWTHGEASDPSQSMRCSANERTNSFNESLGHLPSTTVQGYCAFG